MTAPRYTIWLCPECREQVEEPGHNVYLIDLEGAGHYHENENYDPECGEPYERWVEAERVAVLLAEEAP